MASIVGKRVNGQTYYYLATSARVDGKPRIVAQEYLGSASSIADAMRSAGDVERVRQRPYGDLVAVFRTIDDLRIAALADELVGRQRAGVSVGTCLALAVAHRLLAAPDETVPDWFARAAVGRVVRGRPPTSARLARALPGVPAAILAAVGTRAREVLGSEDERTLLLHDLRITLDGAVPVSGVDGTVLLESGALGHPTQSFVGALPITDYPELLAVRPRQRSVVDAARFPGVTAFDTRALVAGVDRRVIVVHSANAAAAQASSLEAELAVATRRLDRLAELLESGAVRIGREKTATDVARITRVRGVDRVVKAVLTNDSLTWSVDEAARKRLTDEVFGTQLLITDHANWSVADVLTAYRARFRLESTLRAFAEPRDLVGVLAVTVAHLMRHRAHQAGVDLSVPELLQTLAGITESELVSPSTGGRPRVRRLLNEPTPLQRELLALYRTERSP